MMNLFKNIVVVMLLVASIASLGCKGNTFAALQGVFTKDGLVVVNAVPLGSTPKEVTVTGNGQSKTPNWRILGDSSLFIQEAWQPGVNYEVRIDGRIWSGMAPMNPTPLLVCSGELGALEQTPSLKDWSPAVYEDVAVSADGKYIGVASFDHSVYLYDNTGKKIWEYRIPGGVGVAVAFAADGSKLYVGESSPDGNLYAFDSASGKILWQYGMVADIGNSKTTKWNSRPKITNVVVAGDKVTASAEYTERVAEQAGEKAKVSYVTSCVVRTFDGTTGESKWRYPETGVMDTGVSRLTYAADGSKLVFANHSWSKGQMYLDGSIRILEGVTGQLIGFHQLTPKGKQFSYVGIFDGISISPNGKYLSVVTADNRGMLFDISGITGKASETTGVSQEFRLLWLRQISNIQQVGGVPVYAYGNTAQVTDEGNVFFMTGATFLADKTATAGAPPFIHPDATTMFAYSNSGALLWKWQSEGGISKLKFSQDRRYVAIPIYHNYVTNQKDKSGIYCLDLAQAKGEPLVWFYPLEGVAVAAGISNNGSIINGIEAPIRQLDDTVVGKHRLHILR